MNLSSYPKIFALGHRATADLLKAEVIVEEKVDGSQISFMLTEEGELQMRSKGAYLNTGAPDNMFKRGCAAIEAVKNELKPGWAYRGEYLQKPKHNTLAYDRIPTNHIIIFDVQSGEETYLPPEARAAEAARLGFESIPVLHQGMVEDLQFFRQLLDTTSCLGGQKVEGVVVKPAKFDLFGIDKKCVMGKFVSEHFKEVHTGEWKERNPSQTDIVERLVESYKTPARWAKAVQHAAEAGTLEHSPKDIGSLIKGIADDVLAECKDEILAALYEWALPHFKRGLIRGFPEWYKEELLKRQFEP